MTTPHPDAEEHRRLDEVDQAADALLAAFAAHDTAAYFAAFAPDATFVFHNHGSILDSRAAYAATWREWEREGFRVEACESHERHVALVAADTAIMTHRVHTRLAGVPDVLRERETIVFRREPTGSWLAVHEHLSPDPAAGD